MSNACLGSLHRTVLSFAKPLASRVATCHGGRQLHASLRPNSSVILRALSLQSRLSSESFGHSSCRSFLRSRNFSESLPFSAARKKRAGRPSATPTRAISKDELDAAFGYDIDPSVGVSVLQALHERRVTGSLVERGVHFENVDVSKESRTKALEWLRKHFPVDEEAAAEQWTNRTVTKLEHEHTKKVQEHGLMIGDPGDAKAAEYDPYSRPGNRSVLDEMRIYKAERAKEEARLREESGQARQERELQVVKQDEVKQHALKKAARRQKQEEDAYIIKDNESTKMSMSARLLPSTIFLALFTVAMVYLSESYVPPENARRLWNDIPPTIATLTGIGSIMTLITLLWHYPRAWKILNKYAVAAPSYPSAITMFGNVFSHQTFTHLFANITFLFLYGVPLHEDIGRGNFMAIFCGGGVFASVTSLYIHVLINRLYTFSSGGSGAVAAVMFAWIYFNATNPGGPFAASSDIGSILKFLGYVTVLAQIPLNLLPAVQNRVDVFSHLGGAVFGLVAAMALKARMKWKYEHSVAAKEQSKIMDNN